MTFGKNEAECYVPDGASPDAAMGRATILAIGAHPDDLVVMALPGILEALHRGGRQFFGIVATHGGSDPRTGSYAGLTYDEIREIRREEQCQAADIGGYSGIVQLMYDSREVKDLADTRLERDLQAILDAVRPDRVFLHNPCDRHDTHVAVCLRSIRALRAVTASTGWMPEAVLGCEVWRSLDWVVHHDRVHVRLHDEGMLSDHLIHAYKSQYAQNTQYEMALRGRRIVNATHQEALSQGEAHQVEFAMDLLPLVRDPSLDVETFVRHILHHFEHDVMSRVTHFSSIGG